ncbi:DNA gyrase subunit A [Alphaproteobacteria bacterium]|nr:DNA gyrase subunit A [Alphaproteobacteria bacterium]
MTTAPTEHENIQQIHLEDEMQRSYLDYAMSVIVSRAIPDLRDGLKPVHRRILYAMYEGGNTHDKPFRKCADALGNVLRKYHPHGDAPVYEALARMAQDFSMSALLIEGQGNFGSIDGDPPAAFRYTEARLHKIAPSILQDIDKKTADFQPNFDGRFQEPTVLPARFPNVLVNGAGGIAVGMATNIPPHNLGEVLDACMHMIHNPEATLEDLHAFVKGPDFPTRGIIMGRKGIFDALSTGRGSIILRSRSHVEEVRKDRQAIIITEVPYQVNKARAVERIAELVNSKVIEGISDLRDETDRTGIRVVIELKRDADPDVILNQLFKHTPLQVSFGANMLSIYNGRPQTMGLKGILTAFLKFREEVITRRTRYLLGQARDRAHALVGLSVAVANLDVIIALIRKAPDPVTAKEQLMSQGWSAGDVIPLIKLVEASVTRLQGEIYHLSEAQAKAILELRLHRLTALERDKISNELNEIIEEIKGYVDILTRRERLLEVMEEEFREVKEKFAIPRRTEIQEGAATADMEDLIQREEMVVTVSHRGYIKRVPLSTYRAQKRGGRGRSAMATRDEDFVERIFVASTHTPVLFFTTKGIAYQLKVYMLPMGSPQSRGKPFVNILPLDKDEAISTILPLPEEADALENKTIIFATSQGNVRRNRIEDFLNIKANGKIAMKLESANEKLISVRICDEQQDIFLTTHLGKCIRFSVGDMRIFNSRNSTGVRGIRLADGDHVISTSVLTHMDATIDEREAFIKWSRAQRGDQEDADTAVVPTSLDETRLQALQGQEQFIVTVTEKGMGKRSSSFEYRVTGRGGSGVVNMALNDKTGPAVVSFRVEDDHDLMLVTDLGQLIRMSVKDIRIAGRSTQGVRLFRLEKGEKVVSVSRVDPDKSDDGIDVEEGVIADSLEMPSVTSVEADEVSPS